VYASVQEPDHRHRCLLRVRRERPCRRSTQQGDELASSHEFASENVHNLAHHWTMRALCIAAKSSCLCRFRVKTRIRLLGAYVSYRQLRTFSALALSGYVPILLQKSQIAGS
jgi:hypothetical protein